MYKKKIPMTMFKEPSEHVSMTHCLCNVLGFHNASICYNLYFEPETTPDVDLKHMFFYKLSVAWLYTPN